MNPPAVINLTGVIAPGSTTPTSMMVPPASSASVQNYQAGPPNASPLGDLRDRLEHLAYLERNGAQNGNENHDSKTNLRKLPSAMGMVVVLRQKHPTVKLLTLSKNQY